MPFLGILHSAKLLWMKNQDWKWVTYGTFKYILPPHMLSFGCPAALFQQFSNVRVCSAYLGDGHLCVLLLLLQLLLEELQVVLRRQWREGLRAGAAGSNTLGRHGEEGASIKILPARKKNTDREVISQIKEKWLVKPTRLMKRWLRFH